MPLHAHQAMHALPDPNSSSFLVLSNVPVEEVWLNLSVQHTPLHNLWMLCLLMAHCPSDLQKTLRVNVSFRTNTKCSQNR